jgi:hypothetical protein
LIKNQKPSGSWIVQLRALAPPEFSSYIGKALGHACPRANIAACS